MSTELFKVAVELTIGGTAYPVQSFSYTHGVNQFPSASAIVAPSTRKMSEHKFDMNQVIEEVDRLRACSLDTSKKANAKAILTNMATGKVNMFEVFNGYVTGVSLQAYMGGFGISISLSGDLIDLQNGSTHRFRVHQDVLGLNNTADQIENVFAGGNDMFLAFVEIADIILQWYNTLSNGSDVDTEIKRDLSTAIAMLHTIDHSRTTLRPGLQKMQASLTKSFTSFFLNNNFRIGDALFNYLKEFQMQLVTYVAASGKVVAEVTPDFSGVSPLDASDVVEFSDIASINETLSRRQMVKGVYMVPIIQQVDFGESLDVYPLSTDGHFFIKDSVGEFVQIQTPWWMTLSYSLDNGGKGIDELKKVPTPDNAPETSTSSQTSPITTEDDANLKTLKDSYCQFLLYYYRYENQQLSATGKLNFLARPGRCYTLKYLDADGNPASKSMLAYLSSYTNTIQIDPTPSAVTQFNFTHLRSTADPQMESDKLPLYE